MIQAWISAYNGTDTVTLTLDDGAFPELYHGSDRIDEAFVTDASGNLSTPDEFYFGNTKL